MIINNLLPLLLVDQVELIEMMGVHCAFAYLADY